MDEKESHQALAYRIVQEQREIIEDSAAHIVEPAGEVPHQNETRHYGDGKYQLSLQEATEIDHGAVAARVGTQFRAPLAENLQSERGGEHAGSYDGKRGERSVRALPQRCCRRHSGRTAENEQHSTGNREVET